MIHAATRPDSPAVVMAETGEIRSYAELDRRSNRIAHLLRNHGLKRGEVVAVLLGNRIEYFDIAWAAQRAGLYFVCISPRLALEEVAYVLRDSGATMLFVDNDLDALAAGLSADMPEIRTFVVGGGDPSNSLEAAIAWLPADPIDDQSNGTDMLYSSGTTGRPKGIKPALPEGALDQPTPLTDMGARLWGLSSDSIFLSPAPLYHAAPLRWCMAVHRLGGTVVVMAKFDAETALLLIEQHRVTHAQWVPTHFVRMLKLPDATRARHDVGSLQAVWHAAAPCPQPVKQAMLDWWGPIIYEFYSGTEANGLTHIGPEEWLAHKGSVGRPVWGTFHICDDEGNVLPPGREGQIWIADGLPVVYHNDPEKTAQAHNAKGWSTLGDIGWLDDEGYLYLTDRKHFMIISGGVNIYPQEIENQLLAHPDVHDVAVFGIADEDFGERVVAVVQPMQWERAGAALSDEIRAWLSGRIASLKIPRDIQFEKELLREPTGKMNKRALQTKYAAMAEQMVRG